VITKAVTKWLTARRKDDDWSADLEPLAAVAVAVAERLDLGDVSGPLVKELRATLVDLGRPTEEEADAFELLAAELSAAVQHTED